MRIPVNGIGYAIRASSGGIVCTMLLQELQESVQHRGWYNVSGWRDQTAITLRNVWRASHRLDARQGLPAVWRRNETRRRILRIRSVIPWISLLFVIRLLASRGMTRFLRVDELLCARHSEQSITKVRNLLLNIKNCENVLHCPFLKNPLNHYHYCLLSFFFQKSY